MEDMNWCVADLIDQDLFWWNRDLIYANFHNVDADAICKIPLSRRSVPDAIFWLHSKDGVYSCKSGYQVARQIARELDRTECSKGPTGRQVWQRIWKLGVPNKIKLFGWRACQEILPTRVNLAKRKIIDDNLCQCCGREPETEAHVLWECGAAQDVWAGSGARLQKMPSSLGNVVKLFETLFDRLEVPEVELFFVQAWFIWNQRNTVLHGGSFKDPKWLNKRASDYLKDYQQAQRHLAINAATTGRSIWQPPPQSCFKLNFDAAIFDEQNCTGFGAVIRNNRGEVMAAMSAKGPPVTTSYEAEALACRKALEFSIDAGFLELIIEGDNAHVMKSIGSSIPNQSALGIIIDDVKCLINGMQNVYVSSIKREGNMVAHALARFAKNVSEDLYWLEDDPPPVVDELYSDMLNLNE